MLIKDVENINYSTEDTVEQIRKKIDIKTIADESNLQLRKSGRNYKGLCPFHIEKTPSFFLFPQTNTFKCFGCGVYGDQINLYAYFNGIENNQAISLLARQLGLSGNRKLTHEQNLIISKRVEDKQLEKKFYKDFKSVFYSICDIRNDMVMRGRRHSNMDQIEHDQLYIRFCEQRHVFERLTAELCKGLLAEIDFKQQVEVYREAKGVVECWQNLIANQKQTLFENMD